MPFEQYLQGWKCSTCPSSSEWRLSVNSLEKQYHDWIDVPAGSVVHQDSDEMISLRRHGQREMSTLLFILARYIVNTETKT